MSKNKNEIFTHLKKPITRAELNIMIENDEDIRFVNTSEITDFSFLFRGKTNFNQDLSRWNTSSAKNMSHMFYCAESFNQRLDNFDTSNVIDMSFMFLDTKSFNQPLHNFDTSSVTNMSYMFLGAKSFNQHFENYEIKNAKDLFYGLKFFHKLNNIKTLIDYIFIGHPECFLDKQLFENVDFLDIDNDLFELKFSDTGKISEKIDFNDNISLFQSKDKEDNDVIFIYNKDNGFISPTTLNDNDIKGLSKIKGLTYAQ